MATREKSKILAINALYLIVITVIGCQKSWVDELGPDMDKMAKGYEKFGTVSMSCPILVEAKREPNSSHYFDFELTAGPDEYYNSALTKIQAQSALFDQFAQSSGFGLNVQINLMAMMRYIEALKESNLPDIKNIAPDANNTRRVLSSDSFTKFLGLFEGNSAPTISNRSAITTAAGDTVTEGIFRLLGNPAEAMKFEDKLIMFGVSMVSVTPGWLTNKNYTAELAVSCGFSYQPARRELLTKLLENEQEKIGRERDIQLIKLLGYALDENSINESEVNNLIPKRLQKESMGNSTPLLAAVSPMTDVDSMDIASSQRLQESEALRIAAALSGLDSQVQAEFVKDWVKRKEHDVRTRTAYAAVTSFSSGKFFGWRIKPRLQALENPASIDTKPENVLGQQAFPVVIIVGFDKADLQLGFEIEGKKVAAYEPAICFQQTVNWLPHKSTCNLRERLSETERLRLAYTFIQVNKNLNSRLTKNNDDKCVSKKNKSDKPDSIPGLQAISTDNSDFVKMGQNIVIVPKPDEDKSDNQRASTPDIPVNYIENRLLMLGSHILGSTGMQYIPIEWIVKRTAPKAKSKMILTITD